MATPFRVLLGQFVKAWTHIKLTFLTPPYQSSLSQILTHQSTIFTRLLLRLVFTQAEYQTGRISFHPTAQPLAYLWTVANWSVNLIGFLSFLPFGTRYATLFGRILAIPNYRLLASKAALGYSAFEYLWASQVAPIFSTSSNGALDLLYTYGKVQIHWLSTNQVTHCIETFNRERLTLHRFLYFPLLVFLLPILLLRMLTVCFLSLGPNLGPLEVIIYLLLAANNIQQIIYSLIFGLTFGHQVFLLLRLFKFQLKNVMGLLGESETHSLLAPRNFIFAYLFLDRQMRQYNTFLSQYIFIFDLALKLSGSFACIFFLNSAAVLSNGLILLTLSFLVICYLSLNGFFTLFAVFPEANLRAYRKVARFYVRRYSRARKFENRSRKAWPRRGDQAMRNVRQALTVSRLLELLGRRQFGFTYARLFIIEKKCLLENVLATVFYFLLVIKKRF